MRRLPWLVLAIVLSAASVRAQGLSGVDHLRFEHLSVDEGLSQSVVRALLQDSKGFIWVATQDGLNQYDGYRVTRFGHLPEGDNSLPSSYTTALAETRTDRGPQLWVGTADGLAAFDTARGRFSRYQHDPAVPGSLSANEVTQLHVDPEGQLWVGTINGLNRFDPARGTFTRYLSSPPGSSPLPRTSISVITSSRDGALWVGTRDGLYSLNPKSGTTTRFEHDPRNRGSLSHNLIRSLLVDRRNRLWVGTDAGGLDRLDASGRFIHHVHSDDPSSISGNSVNAVLEDSSGAIWVGVWGGGIGRIVDDGDVTGRARFVSFRHDPTDPRSLANDDVNVLIQDRSGSIWVGTYGGGVSRFNPSATQRFAHYRHVPTDPRSLSDGRVYALLVDRAGDLWVGTWGGGLNRLRAGADRFERYLAGPPGPYRLSSNRVTSLAEGRDGAIWIGMLAGGVSRLDPRSGAVLRLRHDPDEPGTLSSDQVSAILVDRQGTLWVGTSGGGLNRYDEKTGRFAHFEHDPLVQRTLSGTWIHSLYDDRAGRLWVGTTHGLDLMDPETGAIVRVGQVPGAPAALDGQIEAISETPDGAIWVATLEGGVIRIDLSQGRPWRFRAYTRQDGLPNDRIYRAIPDERGRLWVTTDRGLARLDPADGSVARYGVEDGLQAQEFRSGGFFDERSHQMFLGGINGFNVFRPADIAPSTFAPPVVLTSLTILNEPVPVGGDSPLQTRIADAQALTLTHRDTVFTFEFAALDYAAPQQLRYAYRLDGFDSAWNETDASRRFATYTNLSPGSYVFKVRAANHDGAWTGEPIELAVVVLPPWWMTWWFRTLAVVFLAAAGFTLIRQRLRRFSQQRAALEALVAQRTRELQEEKERATAARAVAEEANAAKSMFLANISHEIRTPLNAVVGLSQALSELPLDPRPREYVTVLRTASDALSGLISDILDLSKIEAGRVELAPEPFALRAIVDGALQLVRPQAQQKGLQLTSDIAAGVPPIVTGDPDALRRVLFNLLANAVKFTAAGSVAVRVTPSGEDVLRFDVTDTGIGIHPDAQRQIFEDFMQADPSIARTYGGTGLGLAISRRFVGLMGGTIWVDSTPGVGSTFAFTARLPAAADGPVQSPDAASTSLRILLVDDAAANRVVMQALLHGTRHRLDAVDNAAAAIDLVKEGRYDVVLMDVDMPDMDGHEATRRIRAWEASAGRPRLPVLALTAHAFADDVEKSLQAGCDGHLTKPVRRQQLLDALAQCIASYGRPEAAPARHEESAPEGSPAHVVLVAPEIAPLVPDYLEAIRSQLTAAGAALDRGELEPIRRLGHNLKGSGSSYGLDELSRIGARLEAQAAGGSAGGAREAAAELQACLGRIVVAAQDR